MALVLIRRLIPLEDRFVLKLTGIEARIQMNAIEWYSSKFDDRMIWIMLIESYSLNSWIEYQLLKLLNGDRICVGHSKQLEAFHLKAFLRSSRKSKLPILRF